eukprot:7425454-Ditylum_brightwellii.AAC.1
MQRFTKEKHWLQQKQSRVLSNRVNSGWQLLPGALSQAGKTLMMKLWWVHGKMMGIGLQQMTPRLIMMRRAASAL